MEKQYQGMRLEVSTQGYAKIYLNDYERKNAINKNFIINLNEIMDILEDKCDITVVVILGTSDDFCVGMDFNAVEDQQLSSFDGQDAYQRLLVRLKNYPKIIISAVEGKVLGGGMGIVAVSDYVLATEKATFGLPEAMWGLLPAMVLPYIQMRTGYHNAIRMMLLFLTLTSVQAEKVGLVDEVTEDLSVSLRKVMFRFLKLSPKTIILAKQYANLIDSPSDDVQKNALNIARELASDDDVKSNIIKYNLYHKLPWED